MRSKKLKKHYENIKWYLKTGFESAIWGDDVAHEAGQWFLWYWNLLGYLIFLLIRTLIIPAILWLIFVENIFGSLL